MDERYCKVIGQREESKPVSRKCRWEWEQEASRYKGVNYNPNSSRKNPFTGRIWENGKTMHIGSFPTAKEAGIAVQLHILRREMDVYHILLNGGLVKSGGKDV